MAFGASPDAVRRGIASFTPEHHRGDVVALVDGVRFVDNSKATNVHAALAAIDACLRHAGAGAQHVVKVNIYMTDISERAAINPRRIQYFGEHRPASTLVEVSALVDPRMKVEIEAVAVVD